jgi:hypothetical protein
MFNWFMDSRVFDPASVLNPQVGDEVEEKAQRLLGAIKELIGGSNDDVALAMELRADLEAVLQLPIVDQRFPLPKSRKYLAAIKFLQANLALPQLVEASPKKTGKTAEAATPSVPPVDDKQCWGTLFGWVMVRSLGKMQEEAEFTAQSRTWIDEWFLGRILANALREFGLDEAAAWRAVSVVKLLTTHQVWLDMTIAAKKRAARVLDELLGDGATRQFLNVNRYNDVEWYNKEAFEELLVWLMITEASDASANGVEVAETIVGAYDVIKKLQEAEAASEYQVKKLVDLING